VPDDEPELALERLPALLVEVNQALEESRKVVKRLTSHPDDRGVLLAALAILEAMRDSHKDVIELHKASADLRDDAVAALYAAGKHVKIADIAAAAGYNDSYVSRIAQKHGIEPRTNRPRPSPPG
jgi:hypothetical protein